MKRRQNGSNNNGSNQSAPIIILQTNIYNLSSINWFNKKLYQHLKITAQKSEALVVAVYCKEKDKKESKGDKIKIFDFYIYESEDIKNLTKQLVILFSQKIVPAKENLSVLLQKYKICEFYSKNKQSTRQQKRQ